MTSRITTEGRVHHAHTGTGTMNIAFAACVEGTIPHQKMRHVNVNGSNSVFICLAHPTGVMECKASVAQQEGRWVALSGGFV